MSTGAPSEAYDVYWLAEHGQPIGEDHYDAVLIVRDVLEEEEAFRMKSERGNTNLMSMLAKLTGKKR